MLVTACATNASHRLRRRAIAMAYITPATVATIQRSPWRRPKAREDKLIATYDQRPKSTDSNSGETIRRSRKPRKASSSANGTVTYRRKGPQRKPGERAGVGMPARPAAIPLSGCELRSKAIQTTNTVAPASMGNHPGLQRAIMRNRDENTRMRRAQLRIAAGIAIQIVQRRPLKSCPPPKWPRREEGMARRDSRMSVETPVDSPLAPSEASQYEARPLRHPRQRR